LNETRYKEILPIQHNRSVKFWMPGIFGFLFMVCREAEDGND